MMGPQQNGRKDALMALKAKMEGMPGGAPGGVPTQPAPQPLTSNPQMQQMLEARQNRMDQVQANRQPFSPQNMAQRFPQLQPLVDRAQAVRERLGQQPWSPQALMGNNPGIQQSFDRQQQAQQGLDRNRQQRGGAAGVWLPR